MSGFSVRQWRTITSFSKKCQILKTREVFNFWDNFFPRKLSCLRGSFPLFWGWNEGCRCYLTKNWHRREIWNEGSRFPSLMRNLNIISGGIVTEENAGWFWSWGRSKTNVCPGWPHLNDGRGRPAFRIRDGSEGAVRLWRHRHGRHHRPLPGVRHTQDEPQVRQRFHFPTSNSKLDYGQCGRLREMHAKVEWWCDSL